ncbi:sugar phosphate isomerase/epimerase [Roseomonas sp. GC11]|uniref:sugar phosphate isomerase/epimerase family protein n=1 Tax=Roseomonas sp. GC11 TaxID=2950546 RepID=UPI00210DD981|nr:sugar phosphate isomerase/epimerase [Roseomonas sp. GC11]MCQ4162782.1 sugar phosphate isomerase/epimerase [Roseomonas sp. GC11]
MQDIDQLSVQLYTLRALGSVDAVLDAAREAGYRKVELIGSHLDAAESVAPLLAARGLSPSSAHVSMAALREKPEAILRACATLGCDTLFMPSTPPELRASPEPFWSALGEELAEIAETFAREGVSLGYHNHDWELRTQPSGRSALDAFFAAAAGSPLTWQVDVAWLARGRADPCDLMRRYQSHVRAIHVKDLAGPPETLPRPYSGAGGEDGWAAVGAGVLGWESLLPFCRELGATLFVVEHDSPVDAAASITQSRDFLAKLKA